MNSCFIGSDLQERLARGRINTVVMCGIATDHRVSTTARMAGNLGYETFVVADATATFERTGPDETHIGAQQMHDAALASLHAEFATVVSTANLFTALC